MTSSTQPAVLAAKFSPRRPWVAAILSLLVPGLGQLYSGRRRRAVTIWLLSLGLGYLFTFVTTLLPPDLVLAWVVAGTILLFGCYAGDAAHCAKQADPQFVLRSYNRWYLYVATVFVVYFLFLPFHRKVLRPSLDAWSLASRSMAPTLLVGDHVFAKRLHRAPARGEIVVYRWHGNASIKRVVGLPGDTLSMRAGTLFVNNRPLPEPYVQRTDGDDVSSSDFDWQRHFLLSGFNRAVYHPTVANWGPIVAPPASFFVLGDNRWDSADSRYLGWVLRDSLLETVIVVYFSMDPYTDEARWNRIGTLLNAPLNH